MLHIVMFMWIWSSAIWTSELQLPVILPVLFCFVFFFIENRVEIGVTVVFKGR